MPAQPTGQQLSRLVYASAAAPDLATTDLDLILHTARTRNAELGITGILLFEGSSFLQVLEGEPEQVDALYDRIRADRRHLRVVLLLREQIDGRSFADWTMGYTRVDRGELADLTGVHGFHSGDTALSDLDEAGVGKVLTGFRSGTYRQRLT